MTDIEKVKTLIGSLNAEQFSNEDIQTFLDLQAGDVILAAALALDSLAARQDSQPKQVSIGKFQYSVGRSQIKPLREQAEAFRQLAWNTPACLVIEENLSEFNYYEMLRNWAMKHV